MNKILTKKITTFIIFMVAMVLLMGCEMQKKDEFEVELIPSFSKGFRLTGYDSRYPENHDIGRLEYGEMAEQTDWRIGQWGSNHNLIDAVHTKEGTTDVYFDGAKTLKIMDNGGFILDYDGSKDDLTDRVENQEWPHFILEVMPFPYMVPVKDINFLEYYLEFKLTKEKNNLINFNPDLHTALFIWYITLNDKDPNSPGNGDYLWFGLPIYDYRHDFSPYFAQQDSGKEDRTDKFIVNLAGDTFLNSIVSLNVQQYMHFDAYEQLREAYNIARSRGFLKNSAFESMSIGSMYIGWELPGNFDVSMTVDKISLKAGYRK